MELQYKIDKIKHLITLELKDSEEHREILNYMEWQLHEENGLYSMNARPLFLDSCKKTFENGKSILTIQYLNGDEGLLDISSIFRGYFGIYIEKLWSSDMLEGSTEFRITNKESFEAVTGASISSDFFASPHSPVMNGSLRYSPENPSAEDSEGLASLLQPISEKQMAEKNHVSPQKQKKREPIGADEPPVLEKLSKPILIAFQENGKNSPKKRKTMEQEIHSSAKENGFKSSPSEIPSNLGLSYDQTVLKL